MINKSLVAFSFAATLAATALSAAPRLGLASGTVGPVNTVTGSNGPTQTVQALNLGDGSLNLTATASASWLSAAVGAKTACSQAAGGCYPVSIALNTSSLAAGKYTEYITLTDPNAVDSPQDIAVTVNTAAVPASVVTYVTPYTGPLSHTVAPIFTSGKGVTGAVATQSGGSWLSFESGTSGIVAFPWPWAVAVAAQSGQAAGSYTGSVAISGSSVASDNKTISVTMNVTTNPIVDVSGITPYRLFSFPGGPPQYAAVSFTNIGMGSLAVTGATGSAKFITGTVLSPTSVLITADPAGLAAGTYSGSLTIASNAANNGQVSIPVELVVAPSGPPQISYAGLVNPANYVAEAVSQGGIVAAFGNQLAPAGTAEKNATTPLATTLGGSQVLVNGTPVPLFYVSPGQINFQVPYGANPGTATVQVVAGGKPGNVRPLVIAPVVPRILATTGSYGVIVNAGDGSLTLPSSSGIPGAHPARPGDTLVIFGIGFGQTTPAATEGQASSSTTLQTIAGATVAVGGSLGGLFGGATIVTPGFTGLTPTAVGLYQANVTLPASVPLGSAVPLTLAVNGQVSNTVYVAISASGQ